MSGERSGLAGLFSSQGCRTGVLALSPAPLTGWGRPVSGNRDLGAFWHRKQCQGLSPPPLIPALETQLYQVGLWLQEDGRPWKQAGTTALTQHSIPCLPLLPALWLNLQLGKVTRPSCTAAASAPASFRCSQACFHFELFCFVHI